MKKIFAILLMIVFIMPHCVNAQTENLSLGENAKSVVLMEASSGTILYANNEEEKLSPASITKIMTLILIFEAIDDGKIKLNDMATTSAYAKSMGGSQVFLEEGEQQSVETLIKCIVIASGNDAAVTMAEMISGSEEAFVEQMNKKAEEIGMKNTHFIDCCGLTDSDEHYTSAKDVAIMSRELIIKHPEIFKYSTIWMETIVHKTNKGESEFVLSNTNKLLKTNQYVKGLKTGSTSKAKYCVSTVAEKDNVQLISVVMAAPDYKTRFEEAEKMLNYGFSNCKVYKDEYKFNNNVNVTSGVKDAIKVKSKPFSYVDVEGKQLDKIKAKVKIDDKITAPIKKNQKVGYIEYSLDNEVIGTADVLAMESVKKANYFNVFQKMLKTMFLSA